MLRSVAVLSLILALTVSAFAQKPSSEYDNFAKQRAHDMLHQTYREVKENYYDPKFHGLDLDARFHEYDARLDKVASQGEAFRVIAAFLNGFKDSHLYFDPPARPYRYDSGFRSQIIGDMAYVTEVRPSSNAAQDLHAGDRILHFNNFNVNRTDQTDLRYYFGVLAPAVTVQLDISTPQGAQKTVTVTGQMTQRPLTVDIASEDFNQLIRDAEGDEKLERSRFIEVDNVLVWKLAEFSHTSSQINSIFAKLHDNNALLLDLRGNPGGAVDTLKYITGHLFEHDVKLFDEAARKQTKPVIAKTVGKSAFTGKLIVLIDSDSASCAELFARVVQLEHRGTVIGDISAGAVMEANVFPESVGADVSIQYAISITRANAIMSDGKSLETVGVMPDERILPSAEDLADGKDPVLAKAITEAGGKSDPATAGKLFPFEWPKL